MQETYERPTQIHCVSSVFNPQSLSVPAGAIQHLLEYETDRQRHNLPMMAAIDLMKRLYSTNSAPVVLLRTFGLQATNMLPTLKVRSLSTLFFSPLFRTRAPTHQHHPPVRLKSRLRSLPLLPPSFLITQHVT